MLTVVAHHGLESLLPAVLGASALLVRYVQARVGLLRRWRAPRPRGAPSPSVPSQARGPAPHPAEPPR